MIRAVRLARQHLGPLTQNRLDDGEHVGGFRDQGCALLEKRIRSLGARIDGRTWHREHLAALFEREARRDQRPGTLCGFDDDDAERKPGDEAIAAWKILRTRLPSKRHLGNS